MLQFYIEKILTFYQTSQHLISAGSIWYKLCLDYYELHNRRDFSRFFSRNNYYYLPFVQQFIATARIDVSSQINLETSRKRLFIGTFLDYFGKQGAAFNLESPIVPMLQAFLTLHPDYMQSLPLALIQPLQIKTFAVLLDDAKDIDYAFKQMARNELFFYTELSDRFDSATKIAFFEEFTSSIENSKDPGSIWEDNIDNMSDFFSSIPPPQQAEFIERMLVVLEDKIGWSHEGFQDAMFHLLFSLLKTCTEELRIMIVYFALNNIHKMYHYSEAELLQGIELISDHIPQKALEPVVRFCLRYVYREREVVSSACASAIGKIASRLNRSFRLRLLHTLRHQPHQQRNFDAYHVFGSMSYIPNKMIDNIMPRMIFELKNSYYSVSALLAITKLAKQIKATHINLLAKAIQHSLKLHRWGNRYISYLECLTDFLNKLSMKNKVSLLAALNNIDIKNTENINSYVLNTLINSFCVNDEFEMVMFSINQLSSSFSNNDRNQLFHKILPLLDNELLANALFLIEKGFQSFWQIIAITSVSLSSEECCELISKLISNKKLTYHRSKIVIERAQKPITPIITPHLKLILENNHQAWADFWLTELGTHRHDEIDEILENLEQTMFFLNAAERTEVSNLLLPVFLNQPLVTNRQILGFLEKLTLKIEFFKANQNFSLVIYIDNFIANYKSDRFSSIFRLNAQLGMMLPLLPSDIKKRVVLRAISHLNEDSKAVRYALRMFGKIYSSLSQPAVQMIVKKIMLSLQRPTFEWSFYDPDNDESLKDPFTTLLLMAKRLDFSNRQSIIITLLDFPSLLGRREFKLLEALTHEIMKYIDECSAIEKYNFIYGYLVKSINLTMDVDNRLIRIRLFAYFKQQVSTQVELMHHLGGEANICNIVNEYANDNISATDYINKLPKRY